MKAGCIPYTQIPSSSRLFLDFLYAPDRVSGFYPGLPGCEHAAVAAEAITLSPERRRALVEALGPLNAAGGERVRRNLERLAEPGVVAVVTGQQAGLFGGPAYSLYKALTAVRMAERLEERGTPAVPVFWIATEDHDLAEVDHAWTLSPHEGPLKLQAGTSGPANRPVGGVRIDRSPLEELAASLKGLPFADETMALMRETYPDGATLGEAFAALFQHLLAPYGVVLIEPMNPGYRRLGAPLLADAVRRLPDLMEALEERGRELEAAGYHQQVALSAHLSLLFHIENGRRTPIQRQGERFHVNGRDWTAAELAADIEAHPEAFSPNALLRPVVQDSVLPTAAFIGGPAEVAYFAQSQTIYERLLGRMPAVLPRAAFTLLDHRASKLLARFDLNAADCFTHLEALRERIAVRLTPAALRQKLDVQTRRVDGALDEMADALAAFDPTLLEALERSRRKITYQLEKTARKTARECLRRDGLAERDAAYLFELVYPHKRLQERVYAVPALYARFGPEVVETVRQSIRLDCPDHQSLEF